MNCIEARKRWMLYLDSEGDPGFHLETRQHLGECSACAKWFAAQQRLEQDINRSLTAGDSTPDLWSRVLLRAGVRPPFARRRRFVLLATLLAASVAVLALVIGLQIRGRSSPSELIRSASDWHEQWRMGSMSPELVSALDEDVDRFFDRKGIARPRCPSGGDVHFRVQGAAVCLIGTHQASSVVGLLGKVPVSIFVMAEFDPLRDREMPSYYRQGSNHVVTGVVAGKLVVMVSSAPVDVLEKVLNRMRQHAMPGDDFPRELDRK